MVLLKGSPALIGNHLQWTFDYLLLGKGGEIGELSKVLFTPHHIHDVAGSMASSGLEMY